VSILSCATAWALGAAPFLAGALAHGKPVQWHAVGEEVHHAKPNVYYEDYVRLQGRPRTADGFCGQAPVGQRQEGAPGGAGTDRRAEPRAAEQPQIGADRHVSPHRMQ